MTHYHLHHAQTADRAPAYDSIEDAIEALGEALQDWAEAQFQLPPGEQDGEADLAYGLAEIFRGRRAAEFSDEVFRVRRHGGTAYEFGGNPFLVTTCTATGCGHAHATH